MFYKILHQRRFNNRAIAFFSISCSMEEFTNVRGKRGITQSSWYPTAVYVPFGDTIADPATSIINY
ncbi:MAG: hypothetical protein SW833_15515 [Cyanobacteriota bacterium]|nr:hypothetical protein [Cyanobacteriota bacterium]